MAGAGLPGGTEKVRQTTGKKLNGHGRQTGCAVLGRPDEHHGTDDHQHGQPHADRGAGDRGRPGPGPLPGFLREMAHTGLEGKTQVALVR